MKALNLELTINGARVIPTDKQARAISDIIFGGGGTEATPARTEKIEYPRIAKKGKRRRIFGARVWTPREKEEVYSYYDQYRATKKDKAIANELASQLHRTPSAINNLISVYKKSLTNKSNERIPLEKF